MLENLPISSCFRFSKDKHSISPRLFYNNHLPSITMFYNRPDFVVTVTGGTAEENQQMCTALRVSMSQMGFTNVEVDAVQEFSCGNLQDRDLVQYMRNINPDLFESSISITGETDAEAELSVLGSFPRTAGLIDNWAGRH